MKKVSLILTLFAVLAFSTGANAAVIDFEDGIVSNPPGYTLLDDVSYQNATWKNFGVLQSKGEGAYNTAYAAATISGTHVAYNFNAVSPAEIIFNAPVNLEKAYFASAYLAPNNITVTGTYADNSTFSVSPFTLSTGTGQWQSFGLNNVKSIKFQADNYFFGMDDITYSTPVPEPSSMVLGVMGLGSLLGFRRKRQTVK